MRARHIYWVMIAAMAWSCAISTKPVFAGSPSKFINWLAGKGVDVHQYDDGECPPDTVCVERKPVEECVVGKKLLYKSKIRYEWVSIPETRYRWKTMCITKEIDCPYCKPVCKTEESQNSFGVEKWEKSAVTDACQSDCEAGELHCKNIVPQVEKTECKHCGREPGETVVKAKVWSCVRVPYTVYRRVKKPVCVKQPYHEKVEVKVTRYVCTSCGGIGCGKCGKSACGNCNGAGCESCGGNESCDQITPVVMSITSDEE